MASPIIHIQYTTSTGHFLPLPSTVPAYHHQEANLHRHNKLRGLGWGEGGAGGGRNGGGGAGGLMGQSSHQAVERVGSPGVGQCLPSQPLPYRWRVNHHPTPTHPRSLRPPLSSQPPPPRCGSTWLGRYDDGPSVALDARLDASATFSEDRKWTLWHLELGWMEMRGFFWPRLC